MNNIDKLLEELVAEQHYRCRFCGHVIKDISETYPCEVSVDCLCECVVVKDYGLAAALLGARMALRELGVGLTPDVSQRCATAALEDPELEKLLR